MPDSDLKKLVDIAEAPGAALVARFEDEVIPLLLTCEEACAYLLTCGPASAS
jgi:hypothetical protein